MNSRWTRGFASLALLGALCASALEVAHTGVLARGSADSTATPTATVAESTPTAGFSSAVTATATGAVSAFATATVQAQPSADATPKAHASGTATPIKAKRPLNPTPIAGHIKSITLPKPVVLVVGIKTLGVGLSAAQAFMIANDPRNLVPFHIAPPTRVPKSYTLQLIVVTPAQDQQTPAAVSMQFVPTGLKKASGTYPSFTLYKQLGSPINLVNPGGKVQIVTIRAGQKGIGVVKGQLVDQKFHSGIETVQIVWQVNSVNYEVTSVISLSKLKVADLLTTAGSFQ